MPSVVNFLGGSPLNRLSWLRSSEKVLNEAALSPSSRWLLFNNGQPLIERQPNARRGTLAYLSLADVRPFLGSEPFFGQGEKEGEAVPTEHEHALEAARHRGMPILFMGLHEPDGNTSALPSSDFKDPHTAISKLTGTLFFSLDIGELEQEVVDQTVKNIEASKSGATLSFTEPRTAMGALDTFNAALFAEARSMNDWNQRNKFCPGCGSSTYSMWGGWKIACRTLLPWADNTGRKPCPTAKGLHNFTHPRTDPVVIMIVIDQSGEKVLLGRNKKFPGKFYSALAGFIEPGESFEDAVKRELWEEAGVQVWDVKYHSGQPWPYPASLMVGFYATGDSSQPIRTDLDNELDDAQWYTREEVLAVLRHPTGAVLRRTDNKEFAKLDNHPPKDEQPGQGAGALAHSDPSIQKAQTKDGETVEEREKRDALDAPPFRLPPRTAIAGVLVADWAEGRITNQPPLKGNL